MIGNDVGSKGSTASGGVASREFTQQLQGYGLTTAEIVYRRPDRRWLLQCYIWQNYDLFPSFPKLQEFLAFWQQKLDGPLFSVTVAHSRLVRPADFKAVDGVFRLQ
ncbi:usg protein [Bradyrhizobium sp. LHD-71]|uniref:usg protein n=1 Tax=Bradyrhizobium sp. LHD-71 TaxID=3072141 RepID=UPI00280DF123|nr:usg protein [Bradyrhizobium sp. LHD-71]MDQ8731744.1 usg protein [Bradyrhizobium sp. LHD-71]